jgi:hypothetical protein
MKTEKMWGLGWTQGIVYEACGFCGEILEDLGTILWREYLKYSLMK